MRNGLPATTPARSDQPKRLDWTDESGSDRELVKAILAQRADCVVLASRSRDRVNARLALGFPAEGAEPRLVLRPPGIVDAPARPRADDGTLSAIARVAPGGLAWLVDAEPAGRTDAHAHVAALASSHADAWIPIESALLPALLDQGYRQIGVMWTASLLPALTQSVAPVIERDFSVTAADVDDYGHQSGDLNPLHFDDEFARSHGFERRISHGMLFNGWLTRFLGMEYPGPGTIFLRNATSFFAPVYADTAYSVSISAARHDQERGLLQIVAQLFDDAGRHCTVSYNDVMLRRPGRQP